ncbi:MAG: single-stranded-DNA-specific exonuclease RecJ [Candidatus Hydrogenedentes bacterium]|nr:single-stranded-DNA-specific exonuclease RecJ [Candidatus Hydrogenedentota bacterium]
MKIATAKHQWQVAEFDRGRVQILARALGIAPILAHLLILRGIEEPDLARKYVTPRLEDLSSPFELTDMDVAVARLTQARDRGEHVLVFGDYDVDGVSATAILHHGLRRFGIERVSHGMPLRLIEGYGLNAERVEAAKSDGVHLIVTVDNGIAAHDAADRARELGVDLIVTDHHAIEGELPHALAVINPQREPESYPGRFLCGAGVAFKLAAALNGTPNDLDIAALGTVADIVPLKGENRVIVALGLRHMSKYARTGLAALAQAAGVDIRTISSGNIGFQLGPRINAAGRLDDALTALHLLLTDCPDRARAMSALLNAANEERRSIEREIFEQAREELDAFFAAEQRSIVVAREDWHAGVIGIVAARIQTRYQRPVVVIAIDENGEGKGSARSGPGFNMVEAFSACQDLLDKYGGHRAAAGLTIRRDRIESFRQRFEEEALRQLGAGEILVDLPIDVLASFSDIDLALVKSLVLLEPFGHGNPSPVFCSVNVEVAPRSLRVLKDHHLKMQLCQQDKAFDAIGFNMAERYFSEDLQGPIDIVYTPQLNEWRGQVSVQLLLKDIRPAQPGR